MTDRDPRLLETRPVVLLVEDDQQISRLRATLLEERGLDVTITGSLAEARAAIEVMPEIDVVLTDIHLGPGPEERQGGILLARQIRASREGVPVVGYSAFYSDEELGDARSLFDRAFAKGHARVSDLEDALDEISELARASRQRRDP